MADKLLWNDRKRHLDLPVSFTKYSVTTSRIFRETGILNLQEEEVLLYRVRDISLTRNLVQRIFGVGTIHIYSSDKTSNHLDICNVKNPKKVKELIFEKVEEAKSNRRMRTTELLGSDDISDDCEG